MPPLSSNTSLSTSPMIIEDGLLSAATWLASPNYNKRPKGVSIDTIVIHNISLPPNEFGACDTSGMHYVKALFTNQLDWEAHPYFQTIKGAEVSAHVFIERDGTLTQFVNFNERAWHAGRSGYLGRAECNDYSIGIELEGSDFVSFTPAQYEALAEVVVAIYVAYPKTRRQTQGQTGSPPTAQ